MLARPTVATAAIGLVTVALNVWWVHRHRDLGAYNVDEVGYMATSLRFHRGLDLSDPLSFLRVVGSPSSTGPLVPLLGLPLLTAFGRGVPIVMAVQPLVVVVAAVAAAGMTASASGRRAGIVAGIVTLCMPAMILSSRSFQYAAAASALLALAAWGLIASENGRRRSAMVAFGLATGLMLLSRTMAVGFLPALAVATVVQVRRDRAAWVNVAIAAAVALGVAGPWWWISREALADYLLGFGYGSSSRFYGDAGLSGRIARRWTNLADDLRVLRWVGLLVLVLLIAAGIAAVLRRRRAGPEDHRIDPGENLEGDSASGPPEAAAVPTGRPRWASVDRLLRDPLATVAIVIVIGFPTLLSTRNQGVWFELPLEVLLVVLVVGLAGRLPLRARSVAEVAAVTVAVLTFAVSMTDTGGTIGTDVGRRSTLQQAQVALYGGLIDKERPLADADPALGSDDPAVRAAAAQRWWQANVALAEEIESLRRAEGGRIAISLSGNSHLLNGQSLLLTQELRSLVPPPSEVPDTSSTTAELETHLSPEWEGTHRRLLVLIRSRSLPFPEDRDVARLQELALSRGWQQIRSIPLPDGGDVVILEPPG